MEEQPLTLAPLRIIPGNDPELLRRSATLDYSNHAVPLHARSSQRSLSMSWYSLVSGMFYLVTAATLAFVVGTVDALIGIVLACIAFAAIGALFSRYATKTGLTVALLSQRLFGRAGAIIAPLILAATSIYYAVFESSMIAHAFNAQFGTLPLPAWYAIAVAMNLPLVMGGIRRWMDKYNALLLPLYWIGLLVVVTLSAFKTEASGWISLSAHADTVLAAPGWLYAFFVYLGVLVLMMFTIDFARFGRPADVRSNSVLVFGPIFYVLVYLANGLIGIFIAYAAGLAGDVSTTAIVDYIVALLGGWGLFLVWVTQARINTANFYEASTNVEAVFSRVFRRTLPRVASVLICGVITFLFMLTDVLSYILTAMAWQGAFISAWVAILLVHILRHPAGDSYGLPEFRPGRLVAVSWGGLAWIGSALVGVLLLQFGGTFGHTWSTPATFVIAAIAYWFATSSYARSAVVQRGFDPRDEVDDEWNDHVQCHACKQFYAAVEMDRDPGVEGQPAICTECAGARPSFLAAAARQAAG